MDTIPLRRFAASDLVRITGVEASVPEQLWALAYLVGHARWHSNTSRDALSNRPPKINKWNDIRGAFAELWFWQLAREETAARRSDARMAEQWIADHLYVDGGGTSTGARIPDVVFDDDEQRQIAFDLKSHDLGVRNRRMLINKKAHDKLAGKASGYVCLLVRNYGLRALVPAFVPYDEVSQWDHRSPRADGAVALEMPMDAFVRAYLPTHRWEDSVGISPDRVSETYDEGDIVERAKSAATLAFAITRFPSLANAVLPGQRSPCRDSSGVLCPFCDPQ